MMDINQFFHKVCFGENGYLFTQLDIEKYLNDNSANLDQLYSHAKSFEGGVLIPKFLEHAKLTIDKGKPIGFSTDELNRFITLDCGLWDLFMFILKKRLQPFKRYEPLRLGLIKEKHIEQNDRETFYYIMENKKLPDLSDRIKWIGSKADAMYFQEYCGFTLPEFNRCFESNNKKPFHENMRQPIKRKNTFIEILKLHPSYGK